MLEKIVQIKNIGRFRNYAASGDVSLRKLTLIHAENGRGKTTLCAILRSLQSGQKELIAERRTLAVSEPPFVHMRVEGASVHFTNGAWTVTHPDIIIFDPVFINENVYSGEYVEHEHRKNLYRIVVGAHGVVLAKQIEDLDRQIREANTDLRAKKDAASKNLPSGVTLESYLAWSPIDDIDAQIGQKSEELSKRQQATARSSEIRTKDVLKELQLPAIPSDFTEILSRHLADVATDAEARVKQQISEHQMGHQGEPWLSQGLGYVKDDRCPFCGQNVRTNDLIVAYRSHFNEAYKNLKREVAQLSERINHAIGASSLSAVQQLTANNLTLSEFWKQFTSVELPELPFSDVQEKFTKLREYCLVLAKKKQDSPVEPVALDAEYDTIMANVHALGEVVDTYNAAVKVCNTRIHEQKAALQKEGDIAALKRDLALLEAKKRRFAPEIFGACQAYQDLVGKKIELERNKETIRKQLDAHCENLLRTYEQSINEFLDQFDAGFRITNTRHLYTGGTPSSQYQIEINNTAVDLGDSRTQAGTPCFKTTLSSGDRGALALAFFLAVLKQDQDIARRIIVFDDPFTSLDRFRRTCTQQLIQRFVDSAEQVIVLSHDPHFLKLLWDECPSASTNIKTLQMSRAGDTTVIGEWDIMVETQSTYLQNYATLLNFYRERRGEPRTVATTIRPFLEGMLRSHFPGHFQPNEWLGDFVGKIRAADVNSGLQHGKADINELDAINGYSKKYHHQQNENADSEPINEDELHGYVKRTLRLVGGS